MPIQSDDIDHHLDPPSDNNLALTATNKKKTKRSTPSRKHVQHTLRLLAQQESAVLERSIERAENERTELAKKNTKSPVQKAINKNHNVIKHNLTWAQQGRNVGAQVASQMVKAAKNIIKPSKRVRFASKRRVRVFNDKDVAAMVTYDSGADGHYISKQDRIKAGLPILRPSSKRVAVVNGATSSARHVTALPFQGLTNKANKADTFDDFPTSLMSVGKTADDGTVSIFTKDGVTMHKEEDVLITCKGKPILIGVRDENGRYRIPLWQQRTTGHMATKGAQEASHTKIAAGKQRVRPTFNRTRNKMDACSVWVPSQINMAQGNQSRQFHWMAITHREKCQQILS